MGKWEQRFQIDDHLGRRESALRNLKSAGQFSASICHRAGTDPSGPEKFDEAASYLSRYELFNEAFKLYADDPDHLNVSSAESIGDRVHQEQVVRELYGDYLYDRRDFYDAALCK